MSERQGHIPFMLPHKIHSMGMRREKENSGRDLLI
jgi:hypothetical protein